jgi:hypothetical protein
MKIFSQNAKMKKTSDSQNIDLFNFGIPAFMSKDGTKTCPNAGACAAGCYARSGAYAWGNVQQAYEARLALTKSEEFIFRMHQEIEVLRAKSVKRKRQLVLRIHDSGDFYSAEYQQSWYSIAGAFPDVQFYAYTKQVQQSKDLESIKPVNFTLIYSFGGKQDSLIQPTDRHSAVFETVEDLKSSGYDDTSDDDSVAWTSKTGKIGLAYHGAKSFKNTLWSKVTNKGDN